MNSPAARAVTTARQAFDPRKGPAPLALNLLTGAKIADVDMEKAKNIAAQDVIAKLLRENPAVHSRTDVYVRKGDKDKLTPAEQEQYRLYLSLQKQAQQEAKKKKLMPLAV